MIYDYNISSNSGDTLKLQGKSIFLMEKWINRLNLILLYDSKYYLPYDLKYTGARI